MASPAPSERAALKVFSIPELAHFIYDIVRKRDYANLMQVCRRLFYSILPILWEEVRRPDMLVSLIPGGGMVSYVSEGVRYTTMQLPGSLDLSRLSIYAPHVKRLILNRPSLYVDAYDGWDKFLACTRSVDLLPNLEAIYFPAPYPGVISVVVDINSVNWAIAFLSTSLQTLAEISFTDLNSVHHPHPIWLDLDPFNRVMTSIAHKSPRLCSLGVLPARVEFKLGYRRSVREIKFAWDSPEVYSSFLKLGNLASLSISAVLLCPESLPIHFSLPRLESLSIFGEAIDHKVYCGRLHIPAKAFPALKHLQLNGLTWDTISSWCDAKPLITGFQSVEVMYPGDSTHGSYPVETFEEFSKVMPFLATHSRITTLALYDYQSEKLSPKVLNVWKSLPLVSLYLGWSATYGVNCDILCSILSCLPLLENLLLDMSRPQRLEPKEMRKIVELLPRLRHIQIPVEWSGVAQLTEADLTPCQSQSTSLLCVRSNFFLRSQEAARPIARYLSILRPRAPVICELFQDLVLLDLLYGETRADDDERPRPSKLINAELARLWLKQHDWEQGKLFPSSQLNR
ncbi:unnamed protein product [Rhizoctonia solani]|uniref:Uncharacterized protein n=2 Tax=Rhizoctonia solani TaxID=456999 RepID=A0A8H3C2B9_9AGAM|nr:hypothetical protein V565_200480 [Rhizoctonia solani 123E]CAE6377824.1 unnamed protein product [Rhizoctonia solani]CAE6473218.1 unnamed protein product [Rhizoctonia solani]